MSTSRNERYLAFGRVHPERANVQFERTAIQLRDGGSVVAYCDASQLTVEVDVPSVDGFIAAHVLAQDVAEMVVGALGFSLGSGYSVELIQTVEHDGTPHVFGVRPTEEDGSTLGFAPHVTMFHRAFKLAGKDVFFRLSMLDFLRAIREVRDCAMYCYRAIEGIKSAFAFAGGNDGWSEMHRALGTERQTIDNM